MQLNKWTTSLLIIIGICRMDAQTVIASSGDSYTLSPIQFDWTLGEIAINSYEQTELKLDEGFHAINVSKDNSTSIFNGIKAEDLIVFPNPSYGYIELKNIDNITLDKLYLIDSGGIIIKTLLVEASSINLGNNPPGHYYILLMDKSKKYYLAKIIII